MSDEQDDGCLRDSEVALMDTLKLLIEVIIAKGLSRCFPRPVMRW
jgi:hypothetical protein